MAPIPASTADSSSAPLADYFFISGIESSQVYDERSQPLSSPLASPPPVDVDETIEEDRALETDTLRPKSQDGLSIANGDAATRRSARLSYENRNSVGTIIGPDSKQSASNRSSATIKGLQIGGSGLSDVDFENALRKFASERDNFLEEIQFTAGVAQQNRPTRPARPKPQRPPPKNEETGGNLRSGVGSIRRRISTMQSSLKRQPSMARQGTWVIYTLVVDILAALPETTLSPILHNCLYSVYLLTQVQPLFGPRSGSPVTIRSFLRLNLSIRNPICILYCVATSPCFWTATRRRTWLRS
jgi:hypothetical protein